MQENFVAGGIMQFALREMTVILRALRLWMTFLVVVLIFTITAALGTGSMPVAIRFFYWLLIQFGGWSIAILFAVLADSLLKPWVASTFARMMTGALLAAIPIGLWVGLVDYGFLIRTPSFKTLLGNMAVSLPLSALFCVLAYLTVRKDIETVSNTIPEAPALLNRLQPGNRGPLLRLSADDHYTQVVTSRGKELILIRFSDAVKEIGETPGLQIHRSHWVANSHVAELQRINGTLGLKTRDGTLLPVSRSSQKAALERYRIGASPRKKTALGHDFS
ncbi:LytTR family DNA-binding domain-containing protein [Ochrobactrum sp. RH2CCR150]|uniref:LytTR family DNA-binding domain-containing protein n=1 Tax=Ochrobactrum sp. RH2CCR150 TaxID=2587044 RepID=UPI0015FB3546|nr:DNA-binding LytR/AlgR family response regulator [Ochrobactrum sp. RH2CCR150]